MGDVSGTLEQLLAQELLQVQVLLLVPLRALVRMTPDFDSVIVTAIAIRLGLEPGTVIDVGLPYLH